MEIVLEHPSELPLRRRWQLIQHVTAATVAVGLCARCVVSPTRDDQLRGYLHKAIEQLQAALAALSEAP